MKVVKMATSAKIRPHLAGKRPALDLGRKGRRWRVGMSTRAWRLLLTITFFFLIFGAAVQLPQFSHIIEKVSLAQHCSWLDHLVLLVFDNASGDAHSVPDET